MPNTHAARRTEHMLTLQTPFAGAATDLAWCAGMFEGEGTITVTRAGARGYTRGVCTLTSTDSGVPEIYCDFWGGAVRTVQPSSVAGNARAARHWYITGDAMYRFLWQIRPAFRRPLVVNRATAGLAAHAARQQGNRHADEYGALMQQYRHLMSVLNHRGSAPLPAPDARLRIAAEERPLTGTPLRWPL